MQISETVKLYPTREQREALMYSMKTYTKVVKELVADGLKGRDLSKVTSKHIREKLTATMKNQAKRDAVSMVKKYYKDCHSVVMRNRKASIKRKAPKVPILRRLCARIDSYNYKVLEDGIEFRIEPEVGEGKRVLIRAKFSEDQRMIFRSTKLGTMKLGYDGKNICAYIPHSVEVEEPLKEGNVLGVDLGIKCPAVSWCSDGSAHFFGNGRKNRYIRRHYSELRKRLMKEKKMSALETMNNKEQRIMKDIDHKTSREIVEYAVAHHVSVIRLEKLDNIRRTAVREYKSHYRSGKRSSYLIRKKNSAVSTWSFYRLAQYIEYKAKIAGITVEYVNPAYTSQTCPKCGERNHADDRKYVCSKCGFEIHRDVVGAYNICNSTERHGNSGAA